MIGRAGPDAFREGSLTDAAVAESDNKPSTSRQHDQSSFEQNLHAESVASGEVPPSDNSQCAEARSPGIFDLPPSALPPASPEQVTGSLADDAQRLIDTASGSGINAQEAFAELLARSDEQDNFTQQVIANQIARADAGADMLGYIATWPGKTGQLAVAGLAQLAHQPGTNHIRACSELLTLAENNVGDAQDVVRKLLLSNNAATIKSVVAQADTFNSGMVDVLNGLADLGDLGLDTLLTLAQAGVDFTMDGLGPVAGAIENSTNVSSN